MKRILLFLFSLSMLFSGTAGAALVEGSYPWYGPGTWSEDNTVTPSEATMLGDYGWYINSTFESAVPVSGWSDENYVYQTISMTRNDTLFFAFPDNLPPPLPYPDGWHDFTMTGTTTVDLTVRYENGTMIFAGIVDTFTGEMRGQVTDETLTTYNILFSTVMDEDNFYLDPSTNALLSHDGSVLSSTLEISAVPIPGAAWLFASGLIGLVGIRRRFQK